MAERLTPRTLNLGVRGSSLARRVISLDKELYSTFSLEEKNFFVIYSYLKVGEFTAVKRGAKFLIRYVKGVHC